MIRGTTPTHRFEFPAEFTKDNLKRLVITYEQSDKVILEKTEKDVTFDTAAPNVAMITLTQEETFSFNPKLSVKIQIRALTKTEVALASPIFDVSCGDVLNTEVLE